jgi:hypothetical protein
LIRPALKLFSPLELAFNRLPGVCAQLLETLPLTIPTSLAISITRHISFQHSAPPAKGIEKL